MNKFIVNLRSFCLVAIICVTISAIYAQRANVSHYSKSNSESVRAILTYSKDKDGYLIKSAPHELSSIKGKFAPLGKNNSTKSLYLRTDLGVYEIIFNKDNYSEIKNDKLILNLKGKDWDAILSTVEKDISAHVQEINSSRTKFIQDSLATEKKKRELQIEKVRQEAIADKQYEKTHEPRGSVNIRNYQTNKNSERNKLYCSLPYCNYSIKDTIITPLAITLGEGDALLEVVSLESGVLSTPYYQPHAIRMPKDFMEDENVARHLRVFRDSLYLNKKMFYKKIEREDAFYSEKLHKDVEKKAPYGYVGDYGWINDYDRDILYVQYVNTNKKTIKKIKFFYTLINDDDLYGGEGSVEGDGPVGQFSGEKWSFNITDSRVWEDATTLNITKVIITYLDGSKITLTGNKIVFK